MRHIRKRLSVLKSPAEGQQHLLSCPKPDIPLQTQETHVKASNSSSKRLLLTPIPPFPSRVSLASAAPTGAQPFPWDRPHTDHTRSSRNTVNPSRMVWEKSRTWVCGDHVQNNPILKGFWSLYYNQAHNS